jgi:hypothetical protein
MADNAHSLVRKADGSYNARNQPYSLSLRSFCCCFFLSKDYSLCPRSGSRIKRDVAGTSVTTRML